MKNKRNLQSNYHFIQKLSFYFNQKKSYISSTNGLNCNSINKEEIIKQIISRDKLINYDLFFRDIFLSNQKINKYIDIHKLSNIHYADNLESIQIILRILSQKRIKKLLINDFKLINSLNKYIKDFENIFTKISKVYLVTDNYPKKMKDTSCQVYCIEYDNGDIFYFKNTKKNFKDERLFIDSTLKNSELRPCHLNLNAKYTKEQLYRLLRFKIKHLKNKNVSEIILMILNKMMTLQLPVTKLRVDKLQEKIKKISIEDQRSIFRDFGEIISAINFCEDNMISFSNYNERIIDFIISNDNQKEFYSCKYTKKSSAKSSLSYVFDYMKNIQLDEEENKLYQLLSLIVESKGSLLSYSNLSNFLNIKESCDIEYSNLPVEDQRIGRLIYIYSKNCKRTLNNSFYKDVLNKILNKMDINQVTIDYDDNIIYFQKNNFKNNSFIFESSVSVNKYNSKLNFKMDL